MAPKPTLDLAQLPALIQEIFEGAQESYSSHKRRTKSLLKLHSDAVQLTQIVKKQDSLLLIGEKTFNKAFWDILLALLPLKKGVSEAERCVRFVGDFIGALVLQHGEFILSSK